MKFGYILSIIIFYKISLYEINSLPQRNFVFNPLHLIDSAASAVSGIGNQVIQKISSPRNPFRGPKQLLFGLPEVAIFRALHELCSLYLASGNVDPKVTPDVQEMYFQLSTPCLSASFRIEDAAHILQAPQFHVHQPLVLFISGWTSTIESDSVIYMAKAYNCRGGYNFLALNASNFIDTLYTWSALNTEAVGRIVAQGLVQLHAQVPARNMHIIGFSLGAHIASFAARYFRNATGEKIHRITGLDPANPCFGDISLTGLQRTDATFVDVIHTNPGALGESKALGDMDFYVQGLAPIKPGCEKFGCSHSRAWKYYAESVYPGHETNFLAAHCSTDTGSCPQPDTVMGLTAPPKARGTYMLNVNPEAPYGKNAHYNADLTRSGCGFCDHE